MTPNEMLLSAARSGDVASAKKAIVNGADVNHGMGQQCTPLHLATAFGHLPIAKLLLKHQANIDALDDCGETPLHLSFAGSDRSMIVAELLIKSGAEVNCMDDIQSTPLHCAAAKGLTKIAKLLLENGANVNAKDIYQRTPVDLAAAKNHPQVVFLLQEFAKQPTSQRGRG